MTKPHNLSPAEDHRTNTARHMGKGPFVALMDMARPFIVFPPNAQRLLVANLLINTGLGIFGVVFNLYLVAIRFDIQVVGLLSAVNTMATAAAALTIGPLLRRLPVRMVMMIGLGLLTVGTLGSIYFTSALALVLLSACSGAGVALSNTPASLVIMELRDYQARTRLFATYFAIFTGGATLGSLLSGLIPLALAPFPGIASDTVGMFRLVMLVGTILIGLAFLAFKGMTEARDTRSTTTEISSSPLAIHPYRSHPYRDLTMVLTSVAIMSMSIGIVIPFANLYFADELHATPTEIGLIFSLAMITATILTFGGPAVANRIGKLRAFVLIRLLSAPAFIMMALHLPLGLAATAFIVRNIAGSISGSLDNNFMMEVLPASVRATAASSRSATFNLAWAISSYAGGILIGKISYAPLFWVGAILTIVSMGLYYAYFFMTGGDDAPSAQRSMAHE